MTFYLVSHKHDAEQCGEAMAAFKRAGSTTDLKAIGNNLFCTCPSEHGGLFVTEADNEPQVKAYLAELNKGENTILQADRMNFS